jgi:hypothetical protein
MKKQHLKKKNLCFYKVSEYRVSDPRILKSIRVLVSDTGVEVSEDQVSDTEKSIGCPALIIPEICFSGLDASAKRVCVVSMTTTEMFLAACTHDTIESVSEAVVSVVCTLTTA